MMLSKATPKTHVSALGPRVSDCGIASIRVQSIERLRWRYFPAKLPSINDPLHLGPPFLPVQAKREPEANSVSLRL